MKINQSNLTDYQYGLYDDYLSQLDDNLILYSNQNSMSIQYWNIVVQESFNTNDLSFQNSYKKFTYDIYHFMPTLEMSPLTYQINYETQHSGTSNIATGSMTIFLLDKPLPGDLFTFYSTEDVHNSGEVFRVSNVRYMRTTKNKLKLFQLDFETAPLTRNSVDNLRINNIYYWDTELNKFFPEDKYNILLDLNENRDELLNEINKYYNPITGVYEESENTNPVLLNSILKKIKLAFPDIDIKMQHGMLFKDLDLEEFLNTEEVNYIDWNKCSEDEVQDKNSNLYKLVKKLLELYYPLAPEEISDTEVPNKCNSDNLNNCTNMTDTSGTTKFFYENPNSKEIALYPGTIEIPLYIDDSSTPRGTTRLYIGEES